MNDSLFAFRRLWIALALVTGLLVAFLPSAAFADRARAAAERPNIIILMLDDLGYSDLGAYGGEIRTPHIDRLAEGGLRFTQFYNSARCCPTRASLLTGLYPHQVGLVRNGASLTRDGVTIAEVLRGAGYQTAMTGKWHLSVAETLDPPSRHLQWLNHQLDPERPFAPLETYPINRGFDRYYGNIWGVVNYFDPFSLVEGDSPVPTVSEDYYLTDAITDKSIQYLREMSDSEDPFFLYVAHCAPHWPLHARPEDIARYKDAYTAGWHQLRRDRYRRQVEMGLIDPDTHPLPELMGQGDDWDALDAQTRRWMSDQMAVHAAMIDRVDQGVGRIIATLEETGLYENTLFLVLSDNGASPERYLNPGYDRPSETRDGRQIQYRGTFDPGSETTWPYIGSYWASAANTPFRYWKMESFEGGAHTPMIVHWPAGLRTPAGTMTDQTGHVIDILPTCLELAGAEYPRQYAGRAIQPAEGKSLVPILRGEPRRGHEALYFEHVGGKAIIDDGWKLVEPAKGRQWELYHLAEDRTETRNVAAEHPEKVRQLQRKWLEWADRVGAPYEPGLRGQAPRDQVLRAGMALGGDSAPQVAQRPLILSVRIDAEGTGGGVIASQGGSTMGWSLYLDGSRPVWAVRREGRLSEVRSEAALPAGPVELEAQLRADGTITLAMNGRSMGSTDAGGLLTSQPADPLLVGDDRASAVGAYDTAHPFRGRFLEGNLHLQALGEDVSSSK